jgi:hypothetical protein
VMGSKYCACCMEIETCRGFSTSRKTPQ